MTIEEKAGSLASKINNGNTAIDPATLAILIALIKDIFTALKDCGRNPEYAYQSMKNIGLIDRVRLRATIRRSLGTQKYAEIGNKVFNALEDIGSEVELDEVKSMYNEV